MILLINGLFAQSLRYAQKIILEISTICLWLFFSHALILNENPHKSTESSMNTNLFFVKGKSFELADTGGTAMRQKVADGNRRSNQIQHKNM